MHLCNRFGTVKNGSLQQFFEHAPESSAENQVWWEKMVPSYDEVLVISHARRLKQLI